MTYTGLDIDEEGLCTDFNVCRDCTGPPPKANETGLENCWAIKNPKRYFVSEYGHVSGV